MSVQARESLQKLKDYVPGKSIQEVKAQYKLDKIVKLASNENPLGVPVKSQEAIGVHISQLFQYPQGNSPELRDALSSKLQIDSNQLVFSNGSDEMVQMVCNAYLEPGEVTLCSEHTFSEYKFSTLVCGGVYETVPLKNWCYDLDAMLQAITPNTKLVFICNPNNPTGTWRNHQDIINFLDQVPAHVMVVVDEAYVEYAVDSTFPKLLAQLSIRQNLIILRTFSKLYGLAGLRVGYAISNSQVISQINKVKQPFNVNRLAQIAAEAALTDIDHIASSLQVNSEGMIRVQSFLAEMGWEFLETQANFIAFNLGNKAVDYVKKLESQGMIIRSLASFHLDEWVRLTIGTEEELNLWMKLTQEWASK